VDDQQLGRLVRSIRLRRGLRQVDVAGVAGLSHGTVSLVERGHIDKLSLAAVRRVAAAVDVRIELTGRWRGGDAERLLSRRHSLLAESFAAFVAAQAGWAAEPEVSFSIYGERGVIDQLLWHQASAHLLVIELKTEFADVNEMLGTFDRKIRLAQAVAVGRGWRPRLVSAWLVVSDTRTNRRHARQHRTLLRSRFRLDGRGLRAFLRDPARTTTGLAFWTDANARSRRREGGRDYARTRPVGATGQGRGRPGRPGWPGWA
jgi:transcriptional regulator with XRE-family HTH domain